MRQKGSFWNWYKMMGKIKALKVCQTCTKWLYAHALRLFSNDDPGLTLIIFMTASNLFLMLLYGWQLIEHWVLLHFQAFLIQHILSTQVSDTGPVVLWFQCKIKFYFTEWTPKAVFSRPIQDLVFISEIKFDLTLKKIKFSVSFVLIFTIIKFLPTLQFGLVQRV